MLDDESVPQRPPGPRCIEILELMTELVEEALDASDRDRVEAHLAECVGCSIHLRQLQTTIDLIAAAGRHARGTRRGPV